ncbi:hypothetical protein [Blastomonas sp.]|uniref:hypothetical protein n=1 Tax=Blastomonas sp. TaxID=1909299 RepID=UPI00359441B4
MLRARPLRLLALTAASLLLSACLLSPGKFTADMTVLRDGGFTFSYKGDIFMLGLSQLVAMGAALDDNSETEFVPDPCYGDPAPIDGALLKTAYAQDEWAAEALERECTPAEIENQKTAWKDARTAKQAEDARNMEVLKALMGGIDPTAPEAVDEFITRIKKQKGWREIVHKGDGLFVVEYAVSGRIDQDYTFPVIERTQGLTPFVVAAARANGAVRIDAPAFTGAAQGGFIGGNMGGLLPILQAVGATGSGKEANLFASLPKLDGRFTIRTDGEILTNNTEDGPVTDGTQRVMSWVITPRRDRAPEALIMLDAR